MSILERINTVGMAVQVSQFQLSHDALKAFPADLQAKAEIFRASFLALHHMKKAETNFAGDGLLGASTIRGRTDAKIYLAQVNPNDETRMIWSTKRIGCAIPKTYLVFDPTTGKSELGETIADAARNAREAEQEADRSKLFNILLQHPDIEHAELLPAKESAVHRSGTVWQECQARTRSSFSRTRRCPMPFSSEQSS